MILSGFEEKSLEMWSELYDMEEYGRIERHSMVGAFIYLGIRSGWMYNSFKTAIVQ